MEIDQSVYDLAKRSVELDAQCDKLNKEKTMLMEEVMIKYTKAKSKCGKTEAKLREENGKCTQLEIDLKEAAANLEDKTAMISKLEEENKTLEEEIMELLSIRHEALKRQKCQPEKDLEEDNSFEDKAGKISQLEEEKKMLEKEIMELSARNGAVERQKRQSEMDLEEDNNFEDKAGKISKLEEEKKMLEEEIMELSTRNGALERQKRQSEMDLKERMDKEAKSTEMEEKKYHKLLKKTWLLENDISRLKKDKLDKDLLESEKKRVAEMEGVVFGLWKKIESLERAKKTKQAKDAKLINEKGKEIVRISQEKRLVETKKRVYEELMTKKIVGLENQIKTLMEEKMDKDKMLSEREEAIKVLDRENEALEARKKELETELKTVKLSLVLKTEK